MGVNKVSSIIFLFDSERNSRNRTQLWERFITTSGAKYISDTEEIKTANLVGCIFTHRAEYQDGILNIIGDIGDIPVVVFTGGLQGRTIRVDEERKSTFWMPIGMITSNIDQLITGLLTKINSGATAKEVLEYIRELKSGAYPETLAAAYLLMVAKEKKIDVPLDSLSALQWKEACEQYIDIGGDKNANWSDAFTWDTRKIEEIKGEVGRLLSPVATQSR